ncbi:MAG: hypothetical protein JWN24_5140 [Phycisphaerales bacterium]|nr:hypothetical protein [Phycisphaerales bacterium]
MTRRILPFIITLAFAAGVRAQTTWTLTTADFNTQAAALKSIDAAGIHVQPSGADAEKVIPFAQFLDVRRALPLGQPAGKFVLHMAGGDRIGGQPVGIKGNNLVWNNPAVGEVSLPMRQLVAITGLKGKVSDTRRREDVVTLSNGDTVRGIINSIADGKISVKTDAGDSDVPLAAVDNVSFAATAGGASAAPGFRVRFDDGSSVVAPSLTLAGEKLEIAFGKDAVRQVELTHVAAIEQVNGPVSWLSSRPPSENVFIPFIGAAQPGAAKMNTNWTGDEIRYGPQQFSHGIGVHSYSRLSWPLDGAYEAFRTRYAIDTKEPLPKADVTVRILLDGKSVYEQQHVRAGAISAVVLEDIKSARKLTLEVDYGDNMDTQDRLNWIEPALLKQKPATTQPAPE